MLQTREYTCYAGEHALQSNEFNRNECEESAGNSEITWMLNSAFHI